MGVGLVKNYSVDKEPYLSGGYKNLWKIYKGTPKNRDGVASVFVLDKKSLEVYSKDEREEILNILKKEAQSLLKFKHPGILGIQESLLEDKNTLAFVTEYITGTIGSLITSNELSKLEVKLFYIELLEVVRFLHEDAKVIHMNLTPDNIYVDDKGKVKVSGFSFAINDPAINGAEVKYKYNSGNTIPNLNYSCPEAVNDDLVNYKGDIFSLGVGLANLLNKLYNTKSNKELISVSSNNPDSYKSVIKNFNNSMNKFLNELESEDRDIISSMLSVNPTGRISITGLKKHQWFHDSKLSALTFIDNLEGNDQQKNNLFLSNFPKIMNQFDEKIIKKKILPKLLEVMKMKIFLVPVTPCVLAIAEYDKYDLNFEKVFWPHLKSLFKLDQLPAATLYLIISKVEFIAKNISQSEFVGNMLSIVCKCLDCNVPKIQAVVLQNLTIINKKIESQAFKNQIYHRLTNILLTSKSLDIKLAILLAIKDNINLLDQSTINDNLLGVFEKLRKAENKVEICRNLISIYKEIATIVNIEVRVYIYPLVNFE